MFSNSSMNPTISITVLCPSGTAEPGGWGGLQPPNNFQDIVFYFFRNYVKMRKYRQRFITYFIQLLTSLVRLALYTRAELFFMLSEETSSAQQIHLKRETVCVLMIQKEWVANRLEFRN